MIPHDELLELLKDRYESEELVSILEIPIEDIFYNFTDIIYTKIGELDVQFEENNID